MNKEILLFMGSSSFHLNPFPGIRSYEITEDELFFGRENQVDELIDKLTHTHFLAIVGSSGCGKSSLIKAGLVPALLKNKTKLYAPSWELSIFRPGDDPIGNLAKALSTPALDADLIAARLRAGSDGLLNVLGELGASPERYRLIVIDQFEELFRFKKNRTSFHNITEAKGFVEMMLHSTSQSEIPVYVVLSMRTDFLDDCTEFRGLSEAINKGYYLVPRMNREECRLAITGPVHFGKSMISDELVDRLLDDVGDDPDQLPIMQHALMRTWDYWSLNRIGDQAIGIEHYTAIGTTSEALSVHLEEIFAELKDHRYKFYAEKVFKALTDVSKDSRGTRRPTQLSEICTLADAKLEEIIRIIDGFREPGRAFLMPSAQVELSPDSTIDISHESIMRVWFRLRKWVEEESQSAQLYLRLSKTAELYQLGQSGLWVNPELQLALQWREHSKPNATWAMRYDPAFDRSMTFLDYSMRQSELELLNKEKQQRRNLKRARNFAVILGAASVISILFLIISLNLRFKAEASRKVALEKEKLAIFEKKRTEEQRREAILQKKISEQQQQIAEQQKLITEQQRQYAVKQQVIAQQQTGVAVHARQKADEATHEAIQARDEAQIQKQAAVSQKQIAENERVKAENSEKNTQRLRLLSVARTMAIQANQLAGMVKDDLPVLLALQAYQFNIDNKGRENDPDIYAAFSQILDDQVVLRAHQDGVRSLALSKNGNTLVSCGDDGAVYQWQTLNQNAPPVLLKMPKTGNEKFRSIIITSDSKYIVAGTFSGKLCIWKLGSPELLPEVVQANSSVINNLVCSPLKNQFASCSGNGKILLWNYDNDLFRKSLIDSVSYKVNALAFDPGGKSLVFCGSDGSLTLIDLQSKVFSHSRIFSSRDPVLCVSWSDDRKSLAAGFESGSIRIWNALNFTAPPIELIGRHTSGVTALAFSQDGQYLASSSYDRTVKIGNMQYWEGKPVSIEKHDLWVYDLVYTPDSKHLISCSADKTIRIFSTECSGMAEKLEKRLRRNLTPEEWDKYVGADIPYKKTRTDLP